LNSQINQAKATGKIGSEAAALAHEVLNGQQATQNQLAEQAQTINQIRQQLASSTAAINGNGAKFRNQQGARRG
jgi:cell division septum initiation protein DivIVA